MAIAISDITRSRWVRCVPAWVALARSCNQKFNHTLRVRISRNWTERGGATGGHQGSGRERAMVQAWGDARTLGGRGVGASLVLAVALSSPLLVDLVEAGQRPARWRARRRGSPLRSPGGLAVSAASLVSNSLAREAVQGAQLLAGGDIQGGANWVRA